MTSMDGSDWQASPDTLDELRVKIDQVDQQIHQLLNQRAVLAENVAKAKFSTETNPVFYRPEREAQVLRNVMA
ncbi:chorismate mutase, partial [Rhizobium hidalgonense]